MVVIFLLFYYLRFIIFKVTFSVGVYSTFRRKGLGYDSLKSLQRALLRRFALQHSRFSRAPSHRQHHHQPKPFCARYVSMDVLVGEREPMIGS